MRTNPENQFLNNNMKKPLQFLLISASLLGVSAFKPTTPNSTNPQPTQVAQVNSQDKEKTVQKQPIETAEQVKLADANTRDPKKLYANIPDQKIPFPVLKGVAVSYVSAEVNEGKSGMIYTYVDVDFRKSYEKQLKNAGFEKKTDDIFLKPVKGNAALLVEMVEGEGEFVIGAYTSRDPIGRYDRLPNKNIPYPLDNDAFAAEFAEHIPPNGAALETVYLYYNKPRTFIASYEKRLKDAGFKNIRLPQSPLYTKITADNVELSVGIDKMSDDDKEAAYVSEVRIKMTANRLGEP